jgi:hypothetical protein
MQLNGGWTKNNDIGFYFQMTHFSNIIESVSMFGITKPGYEVALNTQGEILAQSEGKILNKHYKLKRIYNWQEDRHKLQWVIDI